MIDLSFIEFFVVFYSWGMIFNMFFLLTAQLHEFIFALEDQFVSNVGLWEQKDMTGLISNKNCPRAPLKLTHRLQMLLFY